MVDGHTLPDKLARLNPPSKPARLGSDRTRRFDTLKAQGSPDPIGGAFGIQSRWRSRQMSRKLHHK